MTPAAVGVRIEPPTPSDLPALLSLIQAHARRQDLPDDILSVEKLAEALFSRRPAIDALLATAADGAPVGYALFHPCWDAPFAARGVTMTELYVSPSHRRAGCGRALLAAVADAGRAGGAAFLCWSAMPENPDGLAFYRAVGARNRPVLSHMLPLK